MDNVCVATMLSGFWNFIKELIPMVCAIAAIIIAHNGLDTWKKQLRSSSSYDLAKRILHSVAVTSLMIRTLNNNTGFIYMALDYDADSEKAAGHLDESLLNKLLALQPDMELLKEEAVATLGDSGASFEELYTFVSQYSALLKTLLISLKTKSLWQELSGNYKSMIEKHIPIVSKEDVLNRYMNGTMPPYHENHEKLIKKVKEDIMPYLRHS